MADKAKNLLIEDAFTLKRKAGTSIDIKLDSGENRKFELPEDSVFKTYQNLDVVAAFVAKSFLTVYKAADTSKMDYIKFIEDGSTFFMSSEHNQNRSGLLSICPAVLTAMKLWKEMPETSSKAKLFASIEAGIDGIFRIIYRDGEQVLENDAPVFDASPYEYKSDSFTKGLSGKSYIDSISWVLPVFLRILSLTNKNGVLAFKDKDLRKKAEFLAKWCLRYINGCLLSGNDGKTPIGWSFTKLDDYENAERSLYFTYAASTVYLSFFEEYKDIIFSLRRIESVSGSDDNSNSFINLKLSEKYWENKNNELDEALKIVSDMRVRKEEQLKEEKQADEFSQDAQKLYQSIDNLGELEKAIKLLLDMLQEPDKADRIRILTGFNDNKRITGEAKGENESIEKAGQITRLKWNLEQISAQIWGTVGGKLEETFFYEDFDATPADDQAIAKGGQTNALFTGLLQIGIILNCAYDEKIKRDKGQREYEKMQDAMFLHVQKTQRFFDMLEDEGKSFGVDSLILRFLEKVDDREDQEAGPDRVLAEKLRKHYIRVCSLTPMLLKTNNLLSKFVVQYPQKQMGESLRSISKKRYFDKEKNEFRWLWETDGYHAISNYYYVGAIFDFYEYYELYERVYLRRYDDMRKELSSDKIFIGDVRKYYQEIEDKIKRLNEKHDGELREKQAEIEERERDIERIKEETKVGEQLFSGIKQVLISSIVDILEKTKYFDDPVFLRRIINGVRSQLAEELAVRYINQCDDSAVLEKLKIPSSPKDDAFLSLLQALAADIILPSAIEAKRTKTSGLVKNIGQTGLQGEGLMAGDFALKGFRQLILDGSINETFRNMCSSIIWEFGNKSIEEK